MSNAEFAAWQRYYQSAPFDDISRIYRPAAAAVSASGGADFSEVLRMFVPEQEETAEESRFSEVDRSILVAFGK